MSFPTRPVIDQILAAPAYRYEGVRKIVRNLTWTCDQLPEVSYEELGYTEAKFKQLKRNYWDEERAQEFLRKMVKRERHGFTVLALHPHGQTKRADSMGFCIDTLVVANTADQQDVTIFYRSTEVTRKFAGDLCFLPWVFEELKLQPQSVTFMFAAAYFSGVFVGTLFRKEDPIEFLDYLRRVDPALFKGGMRFLYRATRTENQSFPYSPEDREHKLLWQALSPREIKRIRDYLEKHLPPEYCRRHANL